LLDYLILSQDLRVLYCDTAQMKVLMVVVVALRT